MVVAPAHMWAASGGRSNTMKKNATMDDGNDGVIQFAHQRTVPAACGRGQRTGSEGKGSDAAARLLAKRAVAKATADIQDVIGAALFAEFRKTANPPELRKCTIERICSHYLIRTPDGEKGILDPCFGTWRLLAMLANIDKDLGLTNVLHADKRRGPFIVTGKGGLRGTGLSKDGAGTMSYLIATGRNDEQLRRLKAGLEKNLEGQEEARFLGKEDDLRDLQESEQRIREEMRQKAREMERIVKNPDEKGGPATMKNIHAVHMSVMRAIDSLKDGAPKLAAHLRDKVKAHGTFRYEKTEGWDFEFLFPLEQVNLLAGVPREVEDDQLICTPAGDDSLSDATGAV
jgi:hypothetical protein